MYFKIKKVLLYVLIFNSLTAFIEVIINYKLMKGYIPLTKKISFNLKNRVKGIHLMYNLNHTLINYSISQVTEVK